MIVAVPILAFIMVLVRHILLGEVYGDPMSEVKPSGDRSRRCRAHRRHSAGPIAADELPRFLIFADGDFGPMTSKTANSVIRYLPERTVGVLDRQQAGKTAQDVLGFGGRFRWWGRCSEGLAEAGRRTDRDRSAGRAAPRGVAGVAGRSTRRRLRFMEWTAHLSGRRPVLAAKAKADGRTIYDIRKPPADLPVASGAAKMVEP